MIRKHTLRLALAAVSLATPPAILSPNLFAQTATTGAVAGHVVDASGASIPSANISITNKNTGSVQKTTSGSDGSYRIPFLAPGTYAIEEDGNGLSATVSGIQVGVGSTTALDLTAHPTNASVVVEVTSAAPILQTEDANITTTFTQRQLEDMPIPGGDLANVPFTAPGVNLSTGAGYGSFTSFGLPATSNLFTTNGNDTMDPYLNLNNSGASNLSLGANEVKEAAIINNAYTGQYGRQAGAQVNFLTKSGENSFHGNALYYFNGDFLNANDWFNKHDPASVTPRPHAISNQWAGSIGGPILHDKLFFFFDTEGLRYVLPGGGVAYIPSPQFQQAVLNNIATNNPGASTYYKQLMGIYSGAKQASRATLVTTADSPQLGCGAFSGKTGIVGGAPVLFGKGGAPCASKFQNTAGSLNTEYLYTIRIDQKLGVNDSINYRYKHDAGTQATGTDALNPAFNVNSVQPAWEGQFNETHIFSPRIVNNFIAAGSYYSTIFGPTNLTAALAVFPTTARFFDDLQFANVGGTDYNYPQGRNVAQYQFVDDLSYSLGRHTLKVGVNFRRNNITDYRAGVLSSGQTEFFSNTDFFNGTLGYNTGSFVQQRFAVQTKVPIAIYTAGFYVQDEYAATKKLNLTMSLRFDRNSNPLCRKDCFARLNAPFGSTTHDPTGTTRPYNADIATGLANAYPSIDAISVQPRFGFAYSVRPDTVLRGGVGMFSDSNPAGLVDNFILNSPNVNSFTVRNNGAAPQTIYVAPGQASAGGLDGYSIAKQSDAALRAGFASGANYSQLRAATNNFFSAPTYTTIGSKLATPAYVEWNLMLQQGIGKHDAVEINYVGNYGYNILLNDATLNAFAATAAAPGFGGVSATRVDRRFTTVTQLTNDGYSEYNGITTSYRHQFTSGFSAQVNYTYSHDLDTISNGGVNGFDLVGNTIPFGRIQPGSDRLNYGNADYDLRHSLSLNYSWQIPGRTAYRSVNTITNGWTASGTLYKRTGYPFSAVNTKINGQFLGGQDGGTILAGYLGGGEAKCQNGNSQCLALSQFAGKGTDTDPYTNQIPYGFGNLARNSFRAPGYFDTDLTLLKKTKLTEKVEFRVGANAFNVLNRPNFYKPNNDVTSGNFGTITTTVTPPSSPYGSFTGSAVSGRVIQLQAGLNF